MAQNKSHAVMQQRHEAHDSLDDFPTPPWATRALCEHILNTEALRVLTCWEPAANRGYMVRPLTEYFHSVRASDVHDYGAGYETCDFLFGARLKKVEDFIVTNPPFRLAAQFALRCLDLRPRAGFALLTRTAFLEGRERYETLFRDYPPSYVAQFVERVPMVKGRHDPEASTATSYCWLVWLGRDKSPPEFVWIPPCRRQLQREGDA